MKTKKSKFIVVVSLVLLVSGLVGYFAPQSHPIFNLALNFLSDSAPDSVPLSQEIVDSLVKIRDDAVSGPYEIENINELTPEQLKFVQNELDEIQSGSKFDIIVEIQKTFSGYKASANMFSASMGIFQVLVAVLIMVGAFFSERKRRLHKIDKINSKNLRK